MKTMTVSSRLSVLVMLLAGLGCSTVTSIHPIGSPITEDLSQKLSGTWMGSEGHQLQMHCDPKGHLSFASLEWKNDSGEFKIESGSGILTSAADRLFFNFVDSPEDEPHRYHFALLRLDDGQLVVWLPDSQEFESLVKDKTLDGEILGDDHSKEVILKGSSEDVASTFNKLELARLFDWSEPGLVLVRISAEPS